jgi:hypothetical protein
VRAIAPQPQLVVFLTDGDPTARNTSATTAQTGFPDGSYAALNPAFAQANTLKALAPAGSGAHLFVVGVGAGVTSPDSQIRLRAISGNRRFPQNPFLDSDYTLLTNFSQLEQALQQISFAICSVQVRVKKLVDNEGNGDFVPQNDWGFRGTVTVANDSYRWLLPGPAAGPPSGGNTRDVSTAPNFEGEVGHASFVWLPSPTTLSSSIQLIDLGRPGFHFKSVTCTKNNQPLTVQNDATITITGLSALDDVSCTFKDQTDTAQLRVRKVIRRHADGGVAAGQRRDEDHRQQPGVRDRSGHGSRHHAGISQPQTAGLRGLREPGDCRPLQERVRL